MRANVTDLQGSRVYGLGLAQVYCGAPGKYRSRAIISIYWKGNVACPCDRSTKSTAPAPESVEHMRSSVYIGTVTLRAVTLTPRGKDLSDPRSQSGKCGTCAIIKMPSRCNQNVIKMCNHDHPAHVSICVMTSYNRLLQPSILTRLGIPTRRT